MLEEDGTISGIVSSSDLIAIHDESLAVADVLSSKEHICVKNNRVKDAAKTIVKHGVYHIVVLDDGDVVGMLSSMDIIKVYAED